jgi:pentatricopeptide repeat protein
MREEGCAVDLVVYTAAIGACAKGGQWEKALQLLQ